jgi:hypothetical protein
MWAAFSFLTPLICIACVVFAFRKMDSQGLRALRPLLVPALLVFTVSVMVLSSGFLYGNLHTPLDTPRVRFSHRLPGDDELPWLFASQLRRGQVLKPMIQDWLSSDRPPLQTGMTLLQFPFLSSPRPLSYQVSGVVLQSFWIAALWLFLSARNLTGSARLATLCAVAFTGFAYVNSFFIWPKLLAAAYLISAWFMACSERVVSLMRGTPRFGFLFGTLLALGLLAHGSAIFSLAAVAPLMLFARKRIGFRASGAALLAILFFYLPWTLYQKLFDPPGSRLLKWHLAGVIDLDPRSFGQAFRDAYGSMTWRQILAIRESNATFILDDQQVFWPKLREFLTALPHDVSTKSLSADRFAHEIRGSQFFHYATALGLLMPGALFLLAGILPRYRSPTWRTAALCFLLAVLTVVIWCGVMFLPASAVVHQEVMPA